MKKITSLLLFTILFWSVGLLDLAGSDYADVDIEIVARFAAEHGSVPVTLEKETYGSRLSLDTQVGEEGYAFAFWVLNGAVRPDFADNHVFTVTHNMQLEAIFSGEHEHAVLFMDSNGRLIDLQYIENGQSAADITEGLPTKPGMVHGSPKWSASLDNITKDTVLILQYQQIETATYDVTVINGTGSGTYMFNHPATATADDPAEGMVFSHWIRNDIKISSSSVFAFTVLEDITLEAIYVHEAEMDIPFVTLTDALDLREGYASYVGRFHVPEGFTRIEYGMITSMGSGAIMINGDGVTLHQGYKFFGPTNEFLMSFEEISHAIVRSYLIVENTQGELITFYSVALSAGETFTETFDTFSNLPSDGSYSSTRTTEIGAYGGEWYHLGARDEGIYGIDGAGIVFRTNDSNWDPYLESEMLTGGIDAFSIDMRKAFTGGSNNRRIVVTFIPETGPPQSYTSQTFGESDTDETVHTFTIDDIGIEGSYVILIENDGAQITLDNMQWSSFGAVAESGYLLRLEAAITGTTLSVDKSGPFYEDNETLTVTAPQIVDDTWLFLRWEDGTTGATLSTDTVYEFDITKHTHLLAVYDDLDKYVLDITLTSNIEGDNAYTLQESPYFKDMLVSIDADDVPGYRFEHWVDLDTGHILSLSRPFTFTLLWNRNIEAVYMDETAFEIYVLSNIEDFVGNRSHAGPYPLDDSVVLTANTVEGTHFLHWYDAVNDIVLSNDAALHLTMDASHYVIAVYEVLQPAQAVYHTGFEDATKGAYAAGTVTLSGVDWLFDNALIGTLEGDKKNHTRSARISVGNNTNGYIEAQTPYAGLDKIEFLAAYFGSDTSGVSFDVFISKDQTNWISLLGNTAPGSELAPYTAVIDYDNPAIVSAGITMDTPLYVRIQNLSATASSHTRRVNVDDVVIYQFKYATPEVPSFEAGDLISFPNNSERLEITFDESFTLYYSYNDAWTDDGCVAVDAVIGELDCMTYGFVDTTALGEYDVVYYAVDETGKYASTTITHVVFRNAGLLDISYEGTYYEGIEGLYGEALLDALRDILQGSVMLQNYGEARYILGEADADPANPDNVLLIYNRTSVPSEWDWPTWEREHVWPQSRLGILSTVDNFSVSIGSDLHNLRAIDPSTNSSRSNKVFDFETTSLTYYPGEDRGDVARIYFYMAVMYAQLTLSDVVLGQSEHTYTPEGAIHGILSTLIVFHFDDAVDDFEINRNDIIFFYQNNRNPFIDYPHLVELIWHNHESIPLD